ncbi:MAG: glycosyltransferase family 4 protein [Planctomycetota bacterium]
MRILQVSPFFLPESIGGVELHVDGLARSLKAQGHEVAVFARGGDAARPEYQEWLTQQKGLPVHRINYNFQDCDRFERLTINPKIGHAFHDEMLRRRPEVVHAHHLTCLSTDIVDWCRAENVPLVLTLHDFWLGCPKGQRIREDLDLCEEVAFERCGPCLHAFWPHLFPEGEAGRETYVEYRARVSDVLSKASLLVTPSEFHRQRYIEDFGVEPDRIRAVENGLPTARFESVPRQAADWVRFGFVGTVIPSKGVHVLVDAFRGLDESLPAVLDVFGPVQPFGSIQDYGERLAASIGADPRIQLHGRYDNEELPKILSELDVLVVPSLWYESFCLTIREGFLAGCAVVASDLGAMGEAVEDGVTGRKFEAGDTAALRGVMRELIEDREQLTRLMSANKPVRSVEDNARELLSIYQSLL